LIVEAADGLAPGGVIVIAVFPVDDTRSNQPQPPPLAVNMLVSTGQGSTFSFNKIAARLRDACFENQRTLEASWPSPLILPKGTDTFVPLELRLDLCTPVERSRYGLLAFEIREKVTDPPPGITKPPYARLPKPKSHVHPRPPGAGTERYRSCRRPVIKVVRVYGHISKQVLQTAAHCANADLSK
jgi:hypothetical protein